MAGAYARVCFCGSFRGHEVFLTDLAGSIKYKNEVKQSGRNDYFILPLFGRLKGETGERYHLSLLATETNSGIQTGLWIQLLVKMHERLGNTNGTAFVDSYANRMTSKIMQPLILEALTKVQSNKPHVIPTSVEV